MNSANYNPWDAFSIASAYAEGAVDIIRFVKGKHIRLKQSPKKQLAALNAYFEATGGRRSRIIYIGTTGKGGRRPATSAVDKASQAFSELRGVKRIELHLVTCRARRRIRTWQHLESALLATFRELYFELPKYNKRKGSVSYIEDIRFFRPETLQTLILQFAP